MCAHILLVSAEIQRKIAESIEGNTHTRIHTKRDENGARNNKRNKKQTYAL